ncbi:hypothetical protein [Paenibacillus sp. Mc5Re-14]|uniref:hypothetical protein n=1 Tax=Paenibacillus sp. Mc5Re-14 TaxID=1030529 RepID=UPI000AF26967|nr:hypothetical protein [Paenibacillus sp. Mc5Re-14]
MSKRSIRKKRTYTDQSKGDAPTQKKNQDKPANTDKFIASGITIPKSITNFIRKFDKSWIGKTYRCITTILNTCFLIILVNFIISKLMDWNLMNWIPFNLESIVNSLNTFDIWFTGFMQIEIVAKLALMFGFCTFLFNAVKSTDMKQLAFNRMHKLSKKGKWKLMRTDIYVTYTLLGLSHFFPPQYVNENPFRTLGYIYILNSVFFYFYISKNNKEGN